jgi:DNA-binding transcriptional regulator LsrR (DeoR family)
MDTSEPVRGRFPQTLVYQAARLYYLEHATQAQIADQLGTSRPTVSRLLAEARASGVVRVQVRNPDEGEMSALEQRLVEQLGLLAAYIAPSVKNAPVGQLLAPGVASALQRTALAAGDALVVSSGATVHGVAQHPMPSLPGVVLCPTVGGVEEPHAHYQTNEITRNLAAKVHGAPALLYAPAMPSAALWTVLMEDPATQRVTRLWKSARAALLGIGAPPHGRSSLPSVISPNDPALLPAVGDICARPYDHTGAPVDFSGVERLVAMELDDLRRIPHTIGAAVGAEKVTSIMTAVRAGYVNTLVSDSTTAELLLEEAGKN